MTDARFDIWPVLEHYGWELPAPRGVWQTVKCYAHDDTHQSCRINSDIGVIKCLACGISGDAINIVQHYEGLGFKDAVRRCEEITGTSDSGVSGSSSGSTAVPRGTRYLPSKRGYVPPGLRSRTLHRP